MPVSENRTPTLTTLPPTSSAPTISVVAATSTGLLVPSRGSAARIGGRLFGSSAGSHGGSSWRYRSSSSHRSSSLHLRPPLLLGLLPLLSHALASRCSISRLEFRVTACARWQGRSLDSNSSRLGVHQGRVSSPDVTKPFRAHRCRFQFHPCGRRVKLRGRFVEERHRYIIHTHPSSFIGSCHVRRVFRLAGAAACRR
jgi:hypothetical protein